MIEPVPAIGTIAYYEALAHELEDTAEQIGRKPEINHNLAQRLKAMAKEIRVNLIVPPSEKHTPKLES